MQELIDRQAALKKMCETCGYCERCEKAMRSTHPDFVADKCNNYKFLAELPTIKPEVRHGWWILCEDQHGVDNDNNNYAYFCSQCHYQDVHSKYAKVNFCWNCGTQMDLRTPTEVQLDEADSVMMGEVAE